MFRNAVERNIYINDIIRRITCYKYNKEIITFVDAISQIDSITDFDIFANELNKIPPKCKGSSYTYKCAYSDNFLYGYANELMHFAGLDEEKMIYLPLLEHGINFSTEVGYGYKSHMSYIFQGKSKEKSWQKERPSIPAFFVGPFVHYVRDYYDIEQMNQIKSKLGKMLLVFTPHSTEMGEVSLALDNFDNYLFKEIGKKYDTIVACVYWADATTNYTRVLAQKGAKIISAGFKMDPNFVRRLKSIISLADTVLFPSITTAMGYAYYCGKKVIFKDYENMIVDTEVVKDKNLQVYRDSLMANRFAFVKAFGEDSECGTSAQNELIDKYWGLSEIKTSEQIRDIYFSNKKRIKKRLGF